MQKESKLYLGDCLEIMPQLETDSIDAIVTDPPYGISFMGKDWDKAVPSIAIWQECLRVLKPGAFAFVMSSPRQDCLARMICRFEDAGFNIAFSSIYHTFASGFPKAQNLSKAVDKRAGVPSLAKAFNVAGRGERKDLQTAKRTLKYQAAYGYVHELKTEQAKTFEGAYSGMQLKPAVEIVIVAMKPLSEKTYLDQALKNGHGCTWLDECRIPYENNNDTRHTKSTKPGIALNSFCVGKKFYEDEWIGSKNGRFPANVLCEDDVLNDGNIRKSRGRTGERNINWWNSLTNTDNPSSIVTSCTKDEGSFSRYFSLDAWFAERIKQLPKEAQKTFPWLIVPKASAREKTKTSTVNPIDNSDTYSGKFPNSKADKEIMNKHPTIKPIKLMSWLITLASREGDIILDPFCGSGTTLIAAKMLNRQYIGIELEKEYYDIARLRIDEAQQNIDKFL